MKKLVLAIVAAAAFSTSAFAADMPVKAKIAPAVSPWDFAFGSAIMNDYVFRGITQSNHKPSVAAYFEPRYNLSKTVQLYAGISGESISFPNRAAAEIDFYGGVRPTFGPVAFDFGYWYYYYPGGTCLGPNPNTFGADCAAFLPNGNVAKSVASFWEVYAKATWTVIDPLALGVNYYYSPNFLNLGANGSYLSGTAKYTFPTFSNGVGVYVSGEFGRQWLGTTNAFYAIGGGIPSLNYTDYNTWNIGAGFTYKVFTLDLRYSDTNLSKGDCNAFTSDFTASGAGNVTPINVAGAGSRWCGSTFIAKLSADLTLDSLK
jgi:uncharacterized protein (TIGR02001 family)